MKDRNERKSDECLQISELVDGRLQGSDFSKSIESATRDDAGLEIWHRYHLIGDVMRGDGSAANRFDAQLLAGIRTRLANEPKVSAVPVIGTGQSVKTLPFEKVASNDSVFRWRMLAGFASLAAVVAVGWNLVIGMQGADTAQLAELNRINKVQLSVVSPMNTAMSEPATPVMLRDPNLDALLAAHKQFGGTSALQMPAGFIRNATFESDSK